jgi:hypothetical protein
MYARVAGLAHVACHPTGGVANPVLTGGDGTMTIETPDSVRSLHGFLFLANA